MDIDLEGMKAVFDRYVVPQEEHWVWIGGMSSGYGIMNYKGTQYPCHRAAWLLFKGPIPEGLEVDHLCRMRICCNPDHLEPVTHAENMRRKPKKQDGVWMEELRKWELFADKERLARGLPVPAWRVARIKEAETN